MVPLLRGPHPGPQQAHVLTGPSEVESLLKPQCALLGPLLLCHVVRRLLQVGLSVSSPLSLLPTLLPGLALRSCRVRRSGTHCEGGSRSWAEWRSHLWVRADGDHLLDVEWGPSPCPTWRVYTQRTCILAAGAHPAVLLWAVLPRPVCPAGLSALLGRWFEIPLSTPGVT